MSFALAGAIVIGPLDETEHWADPDRVALVVKDGVVMKDTGRVAA